MNFQIFTPLFDKIDTITAAFITDISSRVITAITPIVSVGLTLSFITYGLLIIRGVVSLPIMEFLGKSIRIAIITGIALAGGLYQTNIADTIMSTPDEFIGTLIAHPIHGPKASLIIDEAADAGFSLASEAFEKAGFFEKNGIVYCMFGVIILITTSVFVGIGGAILLLTKLALAMLAGLGPLFIMALLWQSTARFFATWSAQVLNYCLLLVLFTTLFGLMISIYGSYMGDIKFDGIQNTSYALGGSVILSIAMVMVLLQLPGIASSLAGGISLSYLYEMRVMRSSSAYNSMQIVNNPASSLIASHVASLDKADANIIKTKAPYGYFKGTIGKV